MEFSYTIYIETDKTTLWKSLTDGAITQKYFFRRSVRSNWKPGSMVEYFKPGGELDIEGEVTEMIPEERVVFTWNHAGVPKKEIASVVSMELEEMEGVIKLTLKHDHLDKGDLVEHPKSPFEGIDNGWPAILSNLKTLMEQGHTLSAMDL